MEVGGEDGRGRENPLLVFTLALTIQLLEPFGHLCESGLIADQHLNLLALTAEAVADGSVLVTVIFHHTVALIGIDVYKRQVERWL